MNTTVGRGCRRFVVGLAISILAGCDAGEELVGLDDTGPSTIVLVRTRDEQPTWAITYGDELWRHAAASARANGAALSREIDIGDVIDRVSHAIEQPAGAELPRVAAATYTASFDGRGLRFSPHRPDGGEAIVTRPPSRRPHAQLARPAVPKPSTAIPDPTTELRVRTTRVAIGANELYRPNQTVPWSALGNTAQGLLDASSGLIEHHEARGEGVELTWVIRDRAGLDGDLVVDVSLDGLTLAGQTATGIHLADGSGIARVRIGAAELVDARGERWRVSAETISGGVRWRVGAATLANAAFPVALDPLISPEFTMDDPVDAHIDAAETEPSIASNGADYFIVWLDERNAWTTGPDIYGARVSAAGLVRDLTGLAITTAPGLQRSPSVASDGSDYLVVWDEPRAATDARDIYGARVTAAGAVQSRIAISTAPAGQVLGSIASNGTDYLVTWEDARNTATSSTDIYGTRVSAAGVVQDPTGIAISTAALSQVEPSVASNGADYLVVWTTTTSGTYTRNADIAGARVTAAGVVLDASQLQISTGPRLESEPSVTALGTDYLVVWTDTRDDPFDYDWELYGQQTDIFGARVTTTGVVSPEIAIATGVVPQYRSSVGSNGAAYLVTWFAYNRADWENNTVLGARVSATGVLLDAAGFLIASGLSVPEPDPVIASNGVDYLVAWSGGHEFARPDNRDLYAARVSSSGSVLDANGFVVSAVPTTPVPATESFPSVAFNGSIYLVAWADTRDSHNSGDAGSIYGVRVSGSGTIQDPAAIPIAREGSAGATAIASNGTDFLVVWNRWIAVPGFIRGARITTGGTVLDTPSIAINTATGNIRPGRPSIASNGTDYLVAWSLPSYPDALVQATRITAAGQVSSPALTLTSTALSYRPDPAVGADGQNFLVAWTDNRGHLDANANIFGSRITGGGVNQDLGGFAIATAPQNQTSPSVASNGISYLVTWDDERTRAVDCDPAVWGTSQCNSDIYGARVLSTGAVQDPNGFPIATSPGYQHVSAVASNGADYLVAWRDGVLGSNANDIVATTITAAGEVQDGQGMVIAAGAQNQIDVHVAGNSTDANYLIVYSTDTRISGRLFTNTIPVGCGNSAADADETCDDGGALAGDGCSAICRVEIGFTCSGSPSVCVDRDECLLANGGCAQTCTNTPGSYACSCASGYVLDDDGRSCRDLDECSNNVDDCAEGCSNTPGGYVCTCPVGYVLTSDGRTCADVDECATNNGGCTNTCTNSVGGRVCSCPDGYALANDLMSCQDVDECATSNGGCEQVCTNTDGSRSCACTVGFALAADGHSCVVDPCATNNGGCAAEAVCAAAMGTVTCTCPAGFTGDGVTCVADLPPDSGGCRTGRSDSGLLFGLGLCLALRRRRTGSVSA